MRLTRIYFRRFSKVGILAAGIFGGAAVAGYFQQPETEIAAPIVQEETPKQQLEVKNLTSNESEQEAPPTIAETFDGFILQGVAQGSDGSVIFAQLANGEGKIQNVDTLRSLGYIVKMVNKCELLLMNQDRTDSARFYTSYCGPDKPPVTPPMMTAQERYQWKLEQVRAVERLAK